MRRRPRNAPPPDRGGSATRTSLDALEIHVPVHFPRLAAIGRIRLLPLRGARRDVRPRVAHADGFSTQRVVGIEVPDAVLEMALHRRIERVVRHAAVEPPDRPLACLRVVRAKAYAVI